MMAHRIAKQIAQFARLQWPSRTSQIGVFNPGERLCMAFCTGAHPQNVASGQHPNAGPPSERLRNVAPQVKTGQGSRLAAGVNWRASRQRAGLRSEPERTCRLGEIERLDAVGIAEKPQLPFNTIP